MSAFAGMAILFTLVPANLLGNYFGKKIQTKQMNLKDQRILKMNEILQGIKVIKYYAWGITSTILWASIASKFVISPALYCRIQADQPYSFDKKWISNLKNFPSILVDYDSNLHCEYHH